MSRAPFECDLRHGLKLRLQQPVEPVPIRGLLTLLSDATDHFKKHCGLDKAALYAMGPYRAEIEHHGTVLARLEIFHPEDGSDQFLPITDWTDAVIHVWSVTEAVEDIVRRKTAYRKVVAQTGERGWICDALNLIEQPGGDLQALALKMKDRRTSAPS